jgi:solute carrier family 32 (vesicular inhibitory amino acid transporter)
VLSSQVENEDGTVTNVIVGQSTLPQTVFNSVNTLIGVGLLALPLAINYAGWIVGLLFLAFAAVVTSYTAKLLTACLDIDQALITYADIAYVSFGPRARIATGILFSLELIAACVALVVLFADSLDALVPGWGVVEWKVICGILLIPLNFMPLRLLSFTSILGIVCCTMLVAIVSIDGLIKPHSPGSLREPEVTHLFPENWSTLPLSFGLLMSPWGGHSVFPSIYRDMRHPQKYGRSLRFTYGFTFSLDLTMAVVGLLMFGDYIHDEVTSNILLTEGYPRFLSIIIVLLIAIIPITKIPLKYDISTSRFASTDTLQLSSNH